MSGNLHHQPQQQAGKPPRFRTQVLSPAPGGRQDFSVPPPPHIAQEQRHAPGGIQQGLALVTAPLAPRVVTDREKMAGAALGFAPADFVVLGCPYRAMGGQRDQIHGHAAPAFAKSGERP